MNKYIMTGLLSVAGLLAATPVQAQVRIVIGVGGRPAYYPRSYYAPRYYYPPPIVVGPVVTRPPDFYYVQPRTIVQAPPIVQDVPVVQSGAASIRVLVPDAGAQVWFDGNLTKQSGIDRLFQTPTLAPGGNYSYRIRAAWTQNGQQMIQEQVVPVSPGQISTADFTRPVPNEPLPLPK